MKKAGYISSNLVAFKSSGNPIYLFRAIYLLITQKRVDEAVQGLHSMLFHKPSIVNTQRPLLVRQVVDKFMPLLLTKNFISRQDIINIYGSEYAVSKLPDDFQGARSEAIIYHPEYLVIGEYAKKSKRIVYVSRHYCLINDFYGDDPDVRHIHALFKMPGSNDLVVTTGDSSKYLDLWELNGHSMFFRKRLRHSMAGHTAIQQLAGHMYLGSDFSARPNYIERIDGRKFYFPSLASRMYVIRFFSYQDRYLISLNKQLACNGGRHTLSVFDTRQEEFIYCENLEHSEPTEISLSLHRDALKLRSGFEIEHKEPEHEADIAVA